MEQLMAFRKAGATCLRNFQAMAAMAACGLLLALPTAQAQQWRPPMDEFPAPQMAPDAYRPQMPAAYPGFAPNQANLPPAPMPGAMMPTAYAGYGQPSGAPVYYGQPSWPIDQASPAYGSWGMQPSPYGYPFQYQVPAFARQYAWRPAPSPWMPAEMATMPPRYDIKMVDQRDRGRFRPLAGMPMQMPMPEFHMPQPMSIPPYVMHPFQDMRSYRQPPAWAYQPYYPQPLPWQSYPHQPAMPWDNRMQMPAQATEYAQTGYGHGNPYFPQYPRQPSYPYSSNPYGWPAYPDMRYADPSNSAWQRPAMSENWWVDPADRNGWQACNGCGEESYPRYPENDYSYW